MEELICFDTAFEKECIERAYENCVKHKFFKLTWYHWGMLCSPDETVVQKTWILGARGQVWYYEVYADFKISKLKTHLIFEGGIISLAEFLDRGFDDITTRSDGCREGYEMVRYNEKGRVRHRYLGDIFENEYLQEIVSRVEREVMKEWVLVERRKVW